MANMRAPPVFFADLENMTKEQIYFEYMRSEHRYQLLKALIAQLGRDGADGIGLTGTDFKMPLDLAVKIGRYHFSKVGFEDIAPTDLCDYGLDYKTVDMVWAILRREGFITDDSQDWEGMYDDLPEL